MSDTQFFEESYYDLYNWMESQNFLGYDPYDGLNCKFFKEKERNKWIKLMWQYFHKFSPINFRPFFDIKKTKDNQGVALTIQALYRYNKKLKNSSKIRELIKYIYNKSLKYKYGNHCWNGHNFSIQGLNEYQTPDIPGIIGTTTCGNAFLDHFKKTGEGKDLLFSIKKFISRNLIKCYQDNYYIKYKPIENHSNLIVWNASAKGFSFLLKLNEVFNLDVNLIQKAESFFSLLVDHQKENGSWYYSFNLENDKENKLIDFHQGFILDSLYQFIESYGEDQDKYFDALIKGVDFYKNQQFLSDGRCKYRWPRVWPIDIHNQSQGIITFSKLESIDDKYLDFAKKIAKWTIDKMQSKDGYFYTYKYPFFNNKIPYMRWGQAWMLFALSNLLTKLNR